MATIPELLFFHDEDETIYKMPLEYFRDLELKRTYSDEVMKLNEINAVDLSDRYQDTDHRDENDKPNKDIYFVNCLFVNEEKLSINQFDGYDLHFYNCVFFNRIALECSPASLLFDKCVFTEGLTLNLSVYDGLKAIDISSSSLSKIDFFEGKIERLNIATSFCSKVLLENIASEEVRISLCKLDKISFSKNTFKKFEFDPFQIRKLNLPFITSRKIKRAVEHVERNNCSLKESFKAFFRRKYNPNYEYSLSRLNTLEFLKKKTSLKYNPIAKSKIDYVKQTILYENSPFRMFMWLFGYFLRLRSISILCMLTVIYFGIIYAGNIELLHCSNENMNITDCIYFSGITFLTIGYGEITPLSYMRILVLLEGFLGMIMSGLFIVVFARIFISE